MVKLFELYPLMKTMEPKKRCYKKTYLKGNVLEFTYIGPPSFFSVLKIMFKFWMRYDTAKKHIMNVTIEKHEKELKDKYGI